MRPTRLLVSTLVFTFATACSGPSGPVSAPKADPITEVFSPPEPADLTKFVKVAVVQWAPDLPTPVGTDVTADQAESFKANNRRTLEEYIRAAAGEGAGLVVTPEFSVVGYPDIPDLPSEEDDYRNRDDIRPYVEPIGGASTSFFGALAKELSIYLHVGFAEVDPETDKYYNVVVVLNPDGEVEATYRKINLFELENNFLEAGTEPVTYDGPVGKVGLALCADIYSSYPMNAYAKKKVNAIALSTSWAQDGTGMTTFVSAAKRVKAYVIAANQNYFPDSGVINPTGKKQSHIRQTTGIAYGYLPRK